jgi:uncharacterized SAM-binding protein YcdF (DUF218 family)
MKGRAIKTPPIFSPGKLGNWRRLSRNIKLGLCFILVIWLISTTITLVFASSQSVDGFFILGGSIRREIYAANLAKKYPPLPILISQGSPAPCIWLTYQKAAVDSEKVWLENCANSTFENLYYGLPILQSWRVHKIKLITSSTHIFRAKLMAQIILGAHGIWVETDLAEEEGIPGNQESWLKTGLDVIRSLFWVVLSQFIQPQCSHLQRLTDVDMKAWQKLGFHCQHQVIWGSDTKFSDPSQ